MDKDVIAVARELAENISDLRKGAEFVARAVDEKGRVFYLFTGISDEGYGDARTWVEVAE